MTIRSLALSKKVRSLQKIWKIESGNCQTLERISHKRPTSGWTHEETGHYWHKPLGFELCLDVQHTSYVNAPAPRQKRINNEKMSQVFYYLPCSATDTPRGEDLKPSEVVLDHSCPLTHSTWTISSRPFCATQMAKDAVGRNEKVY